MLTADLQDRMYSFPTHARMALDILPIPAASVGVESLFSHGKEVLTDRRSRLAPVVFEQVQCLEHHWKPKIVDYARENEADVEDIYIEDFEYFEEQEEMLSMMDLEDSED